MPSAFDLKLACRTLLTRPAFSLMVVGMLAIGIAGNSAIFSIFNGLFLRPLPFAEPDRLVDLDETAPKWNLEYVGVSNRDFAAWSKGNHTFEAMAFFDESSFNLSGKSEAQRVRGARVTRDMLDVLKLRPAVGRDFLDEEDRPGAAKVALIGHGLWQRLFSGDAGIVGQVLQLDNEPYTIVGVLPPQAVFPAQAEIWIPLAADTTRGDGWYLNGVGRLKGTVTLDQARTDLLSVHRGLVESGHRENEITSPILQPLRDRYLGELRPITHVLLGSVGIVLMIVCANITGLMLVHASSRAREVGIRAALGASRGRIVAQLLTESLLLAIAGGALGVSLGNAALRAMLSLIPEDIPRWISFEMDLRFLLFCTAITGAAAVLFGLAPALECARADLRSCLHEAGLRLSVSAGRRRGMNALVVLEIALAVVLLVSAGLLLQAFRKVLFQDPGFRPDNTLSFRVSLPEAKYKEPDQLLSFYGSLLEQVRAMPGVKSAGAASAPPLGGHWGMFLTAEGAPPPGPNEQNPVVLNVVATPGYFDAIGMTFLAGRPFDEHDGDPKGRKVAILNETFVRRFWPVDQAVGKRIRYTWAKDDWMTVIGVTRDEKHYGLDEEMRPGIFVPLRQRPRQSMAIVLRSPVDPRPLTAPVRELLRKMDPDLPMFEVTTMTEKLQSSLWVRRSYSWLFGVFAGVALLLAAAGIYGVISYAVAQRTREIGIRMALGAHPRQVQGNVLGQGLVLVFLGLVSGLVGTFWTTSLLKSLLFGVSVKDPLTYAAVTGGMVCIAILANIVPARRAASVDPMRALRSE
jgi:putative ABC transport system permease protein